MLLRLRFLNAHDIGLLAIHPGEEALARGGPDAVEVGGDDAEHAGSDFPVKRFIIPRDAPNVVVTPVAGRSVQLTNLDKVYFPDAGFTKGDLLQYYADVAPLLVPYVADRAMVLKRYPGGIDQPFFYMKRTPPGAPAWLRRCPIEHGSGSVIDFPVVDDLAGLLWTINLGCIDLNEWYSRCDDTDRPDYVHFDLDPVEGTPFATVREVALRVRDGLEGIGMKPVVKTTGSSGMHVYVAIVRGPLQKEVWTFAKAFAQALERTYPEIVTAEYKIAKRPAGRVLVDYNQNRVGRDAGVGLFGARETARDGFDAGDVG